MAGKVGSVVAIEPETGEILVMASSPTYDPTNWWDVNAGTIT